MTQNPQSVIATRPFLAGDYDAARALWDRTEGMGLSAADERDDIVSYLGRNPGHSLVAEDGGRLVGTILAGHDGRRGYIHHLAVAESHRNRGLGRRLVAEALAGLKRAGLSKCHLFVFETNQDAQAFWSALGAERREDISVYSFSL